MTQTEKLKTVLRKMFSLKEDSATQEAIKDRLISGGSSVELFLCFDSLCTFRVHYCRVIDKSIARTRNSPISFFAIVLPLNIFIFSVNAPVATERKPRFR